MPKKLVLSPCGTSLLINQASDAERRLVSQLANHLEKDISASSRAELELLIERVRQALDPAHPDQAAELSGELNAIVRLYQGHLHHPEDLHWLLCPQTPGWAGKLPPWFGTGLNSQG